MLDQIRSILIIMDEGSVNRAAARLGVSQPTLTRHLQSFEADLGAPLFERESLGVRPTNLAYRLRELMVPAINNFDRAWAEVTAQAQGRCSQLRIGYLGLAARKFLMPALGRFQESYSEIKLWMFDQTPMEQLAALRSGDLDLALIGQEGSSLGKEFYQHRITRLGVLAILPSKHSLADQDAIHLCDLSDDQFIVPAESAVPGRRQWVARLCKKSGFCPNWLGEAESVAETFTRVVAERGVSLLPDYFEGPLPPGISLVRLSDQFATWEFVLLRQPGRMTDACRDLISWISDAAGSDSQRLSSSDLS